MGAGINSSRGAVGSPMMRLGRVVAGNAGWPTQGEVLRRRAVYRSLTERARRHSRDGDFDECLLSAYAAAQAAYFHHFGIWSDPELDALLVEIAPSVAGDLDAPRPRGDDPLSPRPRGDNGSGRR